MREPVLLAPTFKDYLWGGTRLRDEYRKKCDFDKIAESWELAAHKDGESTIASGSLAGLTLSEYIEKNGKDFLGKRAARFDRFPIMIKLIDAKENLSVQVHPSDSYALKNENDYGKTEVWYVVSADEGSCLYYGFNREITKDEFRRRIADNTIEEVLGKVSVKPGDIFFIEPGTLHAIGKGLLICEIQQNSNTTYRVYDYDRRGADGKPRQLHIEKAIDVTNLIVGGKGDHVPEDADRYPIAKCEYFTSEYIRSEGECEIALDEESFRSIIVLEGDLKICVGDFELDPHKGDSVFIPAQNGTVRVTGSGKLILSYV